MKLLYLSYDGMTDPLGQSQVIPYLQGLSAAGHQVHLMSFEKPERFEVHRSRIQSLLDAAAIRWHPLPYHARPPVFSTLYDISVLHRKAKALCAQEGIEVLHCRSYITSLVGLSLKRSKGIRFIFDMRGFWADERIDGKIWNLENPLFRSIYRFFKRKEQQFLSEADAVVSLTHAAAHEIQSWPGLATKNITVIPCCADLEFYQSGQADAAQWKHELGISEGQFVLSYLGSLGTWYMLPEMLDFFVELRKKIPDALFLFITPDAPEMILHEASKRQLPEAAFRIRSARRDEVPGLAALSTVSMFFIRPSFSKKASSPTKMGELMAAGIPLIVNGGVGDVERISADAANAIVVHSLDTPSYQKALEQLEPLLAADRSRNVACAQRWYALEEGVRRYLEIYRNLAKP